MNKPRVALLDLNYTLVANSGELSYGGDANRREKERYRGWLVDLIKLMQFDQVVLITVRHKRDQEWTLQAIEKQLGWKPDFPVFNWTSLGPPEFKLLAMREVVIPKFGDPNEVDYVAFESNMDTHKMYWQNFRINGLKAMPATEFGDTEVKQHAGARRNGAPKLF